MNAAARPIAWLLVAVALATSGCGGKAKTFERWLDSIFDSNRPGETFEEWQVRKERERRAAAVRRDHPEVYPAAEHSPSFDATAPAGS